MSIYANLSSATFLMITHHLDRIAEATMNMAKQNLISVKLSGNSILLCENDSTAMCSNFTHISM